MQSSKFKILIVDDDASIRKLLKLVLLEADYEVLSAANGEEALFFLNQRPDLAILDLNLPDRSGRDLLIEIKSKFSIPVLMLTVEDNDEEKVSLLDAGADDYLTKPFSVPELLARLRVILRRLNILQQKVLRINDLEIDLHLKTISKQGKQVKLTATEHAILMALAESPGKLITQDHLLKNIWGLYDMEQSHYLRIYISHLRKKIEKDPSKPEIIITEPGLGYRLVL